MIDAQRDPVGCIKDRDLVIFCCRRGEREIQLTEAFVEKDLNQFQRQEFKDLKFVILTLYHEKFKNQAVAFAPSRIPVTLGEVISQANLSQLRVAESEKFAHVTFFFNGGSNFRFANEVDIRIPSPKGIPFDQVPELSLEKVTAEVISGIQNKVDFIVTNFANGDVIGHTQNHAAKIKCASIIDQRLGQVVDAAISAGYVILVTADHGNLEEMINPDGSPHVAHTTNLVPFILIDPLAKSQCQVQEGSLADIAPTILKALTIDPPSEMNGANLAPEYDWGGRRRVLLVILDGWGFGRQDETNPIFLAETPVWGLLDQELSNFLPESRRRGGGFAGRKGWQFRSRAYQYWFWPGRASR